MEIQKHQVETETLRGLGSIFADFFNFGLDSSCRTVYIGGWLVMQTGLHED
jgi:hypothetical protein